MKVIILGNCQVGGLADSLELLMPSAEIGYQVVSNDPKALEAELRIIEKFKTQCILHDSVKNIVDFNPRLQGILPDDLIVVPTVTFAAFHPDIQYCFCQGKVVKNGLNSDWNSRILLWAYMNKLEEREARDLFCKNVYRELGYLDEWVSSSKLLKQRFEKCGLDFVEWMRCVQREGLFMYGINHPLPIALSKLALQIAEQKFHSEYSNFKDLNKHVTDYLAHIVWPVYSEIAEELGLEGTYRWRVGHKYAELDEFISLCYEMWDSIKVRNLDIDFIPTISERDNLVLLKMSGRN